jgi:hypothetical protein
MTSAFPDPDMRICLSDGERYADLRVFGLSFRTLVLEAIIPTCLLVRSVSLRNLLILSWVVITHPCMPTRHDYWLPEHIHAPAKRLEAIQPCYLFLFFP